jgi:hypothetical protein
MQAAQLVGATRRSEVAEPPLLELQTLADLLKRCSPPSQKALLLASTTGAAALDQELRDANSERGLTPPDKTNF